MLKVAIIGAGSVGFTRKLVRDILAVEEFGDIDIAQPSGGVLRAPRPAAGWRPPALGDR